MLEPQSLGIERDQIHETDCIAPGEESCTFAWIEDQRGALLLVPMAMGVAVQHEVDFARQPGRCFFGIVDDEDSPTGPLEGAWWRHEIHSEMIRLFFEATTIRLVVVAKDANHGNCEPRIARAPRAL